MPVDFLTEQRDATESDQKREARHREAMREASSAAMRACVIVAVPAAAVVVFALVEMKTALVAAEQLLRDGSHWYEAFMPLVLFGILGLVIGASLGWRISSGAGLTGAAAWRIGAAGALLTAGCGAIAAVVIFSPVPAMCWLAVAAVVAGGLPSLSYFAFWAA